MIWTTASDQDYDDILLPKPPSQWPILWYGLAVNAGVVIGLLLVSFLMPEEITALRHYVVTTISSSPPAAARPVVRKRATIPSESTDVNAALRLDKTYAPTATAPVVRRVAPASVTPPSIASALFPALPMPDIAAPELPRPREAVRTGSFGDGQEVLESETKVPGSSPRGGTGLRVDATAQFGAEAVAAVGDREQGTPGSGTVPVQVLYKPRPKYTPDAQEQKIEGQVDLEVVFASSGRVVVRRVLRGLGHGLDESAERAAEQITFRPALRGGHPVDSVSVVHIFFALAY